MTSPALSALRTRIATNALTLSDQTALTTALDAILPTFQSADDTSSVRFSDEPEAREWIAALYTIQAGGVVSGAGAHIQTPNTETLFAASMAPGPAGALLAALDVTSQTTGRLRVSVNVALIASIADEPEIALTFVDNLTAVTGGVAINAGITAVPTSTTPSASGGVAMFATAQATFSLGGTLDAFITLADIPLQVTVGHRIGIGVFLASPNSATLTEISAAITVDEV
jgi:hypothetical protein